MTMNYQKNKKKHTQKQNEYKKLSLSPVKRKTACLLFRKLGPLLLSELLPLDYHSPGCCTFLDFPSTPTNQQRTSFHSATENESHTHHFLIQYLLYTPTCTHRCECVCTTDISWPFLPNSRLFFSNHKDSAHECFSSCMYFTCIYSFLFVFISAYIYIQNGTLNVRCPDISRGLSWFYDVSSSFEAS